MRGISCGRTCGRSYERSMGIAMAFVARARCTIDRGLGSILC